MKQNKTLRIVLLTICTTILIFGMVTRANTETEHESVAQNNIPKPTRPAYLDLVPELIPICACESSYEGTKYGTPMQFEKDGTTIRSGRVNPKDKGYCQINEYYWLDVAVKLGYDIYTPEGNVKMANHIYGINGTKDWSWSRKCWQK